jgi:peptide-methionine (S)-S-oxide reductase
MNGFELAFSYSSIYPDFQKLFPSSIKRAKVGFMAPEPESALKNPTYRQVCSGTSGHIEVLDLELSDAKYFEDLIKFFFQFHDPTTKNRQGNDVGYQYASCIFVSNEEQASIARKVKEEVQKLVDQKRIQSYTNSKVETFIASFNQFYEAQDDHQEYLTKNPNGYCNHRIRFKDWPSTTSAN